MLIRRCAWHRQYHGYPLVQGVAAWGGRRVHFTDGMCRRCASRLQVDWRLGSSDSPGEPAEPPWSPAAVTVAVVAVVVVLARLVEPGPILAAMVPRLVPFPRRRARSTSRRAA
jgi:hypothetical protein